MKAFKSIVVLTAGVLALSACDKKSDNQTTATGYQDTTMGAGTAGTDVTPANDLNATTTTEETATDQGTGMSDEAAAAGTGAAVGAAVQDDFSSTSEGSGAISDEAASEDLSTDTENYQDDELSGSEVQEEEYYPEESRGTGLGTGRSGDNYESVDETSSEPDDVRGGRDARMVPKYNEIDNTSSEPDLDQ